MLVQGKWVADWQPVQAKDEKGGFVRQTSSFRNWITPDGSFVTDEFIDYVLPLIQGEPERPTELSLPRYARLKKIKA